MARRSADGDAPRHVPHSVQSVVNTPGRPLPPHLRERSESFFGADLGHVRLHDDSLAATAVAQSRAHALAVGPHILLSRHSRDLSRADAQRTLAHEIAHTLQPDTGIGAAGSFDPDGSDAEIQAGRAADAFLGATNILDAEAPRPARKGVSRERDPRLDELVRVIDDLPRVLNDQGVAMALDHAAPGLDLADPDNYQPLQLLLDESFGPGSGSTILGLWRTVQASAVPASPAAVSRPHSAARGVASPVPDVPETDTSGLPEGGYSELVVADTPPSSMLGTSIRSEIDTIRARLGMPALNEDAPGSETFEPMNSNDQLRLDRLHALETEYYRRRRWLEGSRELTGAMAEDQRAPGIGLSDVMDLVSIAASPETMGIEVLSAVLGHPIDDFATGFVPGFLGGAVLELPADAFERLNAETREHPFLFNGGVMAGIPVGAAQGLWEMLVGLVELLGLAAELAQAVSPMGIAERSARDMYRMITDPEAYRAEREQQLEQAQAIGEAIVSLVTSLLSDPAFMIAHGRELGEIAGRAAANWFNEDFMRRSTFDKGFLIGRVEGRIVFEIVALFIGPEEWIARGASAAGELARLSGPLRRAITEAIERIPALRRLLAASREASTAAREAAAAERALAEGGEALSGASRLGEGAADLGRGGGMSDDGARSLEHVADEVEDLAGVPDRLHGPESANPPPMLDPAGPVPPTELPVSGPPPGRDPVRSPESLPDEAARGRVGDSPEVAASAVDELEDLRRRAPSDPEAAHQLVRRYEEMGDFELFQRFADDGDETAGAIIRRRYPDNEAALRRLLGSDYRPPHSATARITRGGREVAREPLTSGRMTPAERALGFPRSMLATHTEARAVRQMDLRAGDFLEIIGHYDPCSSCQRAMQQAADRTRATIRYWWQGGEMVFTPRPL